MPSFDGDIFHNPQAEPGKLIKNPKRNNCQRYL